MVLAGMTDKPMLPLYGKAQHAVAPYKTGLWFYRFIKRFFILFVEYYRLLRLVGSMITGSQIRAARAMLGWSQQDLADKALLSETAVLCSKPRVRGYA